MTQAPAPIAAAPAAHMPPPVAPPAASAPAPAVSVCINGWADYVFEGPDGPITQRWTPGCHNVENGGGYLPAGQFTRRFHDDFTLCCVVQKFRRTPGVQYHFEVLTGPAVLDSEALFVHHATGTRERETEFDLPAGHALDVAPDDITIVGRLR